MVIGNGTEPIYQRTYNYVVQFQFVSITKFVKLNNQWVPLQLKRRPQHGINAKPI